MASSRCSWTVGTLGMSHRIYSLGAPHGDLILSWLWCHSERLGETPPVVRHRQSNQRSSRYPGLPGSFSRPPESQDCVRDIRGSSRNYIRELTRERPDVGRRWSSAAGRSQELVVDAIFSAHSDGLIVIVRKSEANKSSPLTTGTLPPLASTRTGSMSSEMSSSSRSSYEWSGSTYSYSPRRY